MLISSKCHHCEKFFHTISDTFPEEVECLHCEKPLNTLRLVASGDARIINYDSKNTKAKDAELERQAGNLSSSSD
jgi:hypothetical protein